MSEYFAGVTFTDQPVTPSDDAVIRRSMLPDGVLSGCGFSYSGTTLTMAAGSFMICGRQVRHTSAQNWAVVGANSGFARILLTVDMTRVSTETAFDQVVDSIEYASALNGFAALETSDINESGNRYQMVACVVSLGSGGITGIVQQMPIARGSTAYAPGGYGLGQDTPPIISSLAALDSLKKPGWYRLTVPAGNAVICGYNVSYSTVFVEAYNANAVIQTVTNIGSATCVKRASSNGAWGAWAIENPPMLPGVEYRTTELWNGRHVYKKLVVYTADSFTSGSISLPHGITGLEVFLDAEVRWKHTSAEGDGWRSLPSVYHSNTAWNGQLAYVNNANLAFQLGSSVRSAMAKSTENVYVTMKYTKGD